MTRRALCSFMIVGLAMALLVTACKDEPGQPDPGPGATLIEATGCKGFTDGLDPVFPSSSEGCLTWSYDDATRTLRLSHLNAALNCCPEYTATLTVQGDELTVVEVETEGLCDCDCLYDFTFEVTDLPRAVYQVSVQENYLRPGDPALTCVIDLGVAEFGTACVPRGSYPWGS